jgi:hypothetical protein
MMLLSEFAFVPRGEPELVAGKILGVDEAHDSAADMRVVDELIGRLGHELGARS